MDSTDFERRMQKLILFYSSNQTTNTFISKENETSNVIPKLTTEFERKESKYSSKTNSKPCNEYQKLLYKKYKK